jgi:hypothetical protein
MSQSKTYKLTINSRPDNNGLIWLMLEDRHGGHFAGHIAQYVTNTERLPSEAIKMDCGIFAGFPYPLYAVVNIVSLWVTGESRQARLSGAQDLAINAGEKRPSDDGNGHWSVGPVLMFEITRPAREEV